MDKIEKHPHFDLWLHTSLELEKLLGIKIVTRETVHDWPLSTVQKITTIEGKSVIYKVQNLATVEPAFYKSAKSKLLPSYQYLGKVKDCEAMSFEFITGQRLADCSINETELLKIGRELQININQIEGDLPVFTDIRNTTKWNAFSDTLLKRLSNLIEQRIFPNIDLSIVTSLRKWANSHTITDILEKESCFTHGDPNGDNIFIMPDGYRLIDWQRPRFAPADIDMVGLLIGKGFDAYKYIKPEIVQIFYFLRIDWMSLCKTTLFPQGSSYEKHVMNASEALLNRNLPTP